MNYRHLFNTLVCLVLAGCGSIYSARAVDPGFHFGSHSDPENTEEALGSNGIVFADGTQSLADLEGQSMQVKLVRYLRDPETGELSIALSDETATLVVGFTDRSDQDLTITFDGETLVFEGREATMASGQKIKSYLNHALTHSGTGGLYSYAAFNGGFAGDVIETEGFFSFGHQTDPAQIAALQGPVNYSGSYYGFGQLTDLDGNTLDDELETNGSILFEADFSNRLVSGQLNGTYYMASGDEDYIMFFLDAGIAGNGFAASVDTFCPPGNSCTSASSLGAVFYGDAAAEISGVIAFDEIMDPNGSAEATRFVGAAGFTTERQ